MTKFLSYVLIAIAFVPSLAFAQKTPEQVAVTYFDTLKSDGLETAPSFIHPKELERFKSMLLPLFTMNDSDENLSILFFGEKKSPSEISAMKPADFMAGFLSVLGTQMKSSKINLGETNVIGSVKEGETVHVLARNSAGNQDFKMTKVEVISMIPDGDTWKLLLSGEIEGMAQALKSQLEKNGE